MNGSSRRSRDEDSSSADELGGGTAPAPGRKKGVKFKLTSAPTSMASV